MTKELKLKHYKKYNKFVLDNTNQEEIFVVERYFEDSKDGGMFIVFLHDFKKLYPPELLEGITTQDILIPSFENHDKVKSVQKIYNKNVKEYFKKTIL